MSAAAPARRKRKPANQYHHGNLRRSLIEEALRTIQTNGVDSLTLRTIGARLGVSRTALYRHFSDKQALLAAVGGEGFGTLAAALTEARERHGRGRPGFEAMATAYVQFALTHPAHYRVMFGRFESCAKDTEFIAAATAAFDVLLDSVIEQQQAGLVRRDDPQLMAHFIWAVVHGTAMLAIDGQLGMDGEVEALGRYATERLRAGIAAV